MNEEMMPEAIDFPPLPIFAVILLMTVSVLFSALSPLFIPFTAAMAAFCIMRRGCPLLLLAFALSFGLAFAMSGSAKTALIALAPAPVAAVLAYTVEKQDRSMSVALSAAALTGFSLIVGAVIFLLHRGTISAEEIRIYLDEIVTALTDNILRSFESAKENLTPEALEMLPEMTEESVRPIFESVLPLLPGTIIAIITFMAYIAHITTSGLHRIFISPPLPERARRMKLDVISAYVFAIFYVITVLFSSSATSGSVALIVSRNIITVLTVPFAISGFGSVLRRFRESGSFSVVVVGFVIVMFALLSPGMLLSLAAFLGVIDTFTSHYGATRRKDS